MKPRKAEGIFRFGWSFCVGSSRKDEDLKVKHHKIILILGQFLLMRLYLLDCKSVKTLEQSPPEQHSEPVNCRATRTNNPH